MNYTTYLFDFDYTLADSSRGIVTCFRNVLTRHGYTEVTDDDITPILFYALSRCLLRRGE